MSRIVALALAVVVSLHASPVLSAQLIVAGQGVAAQTPEGLAEGQLQCKAASISGTVVNPAGEPLGNVRVQARDLVNGQVVASTATSSTGQFSLTVDPGNYVIEVVDWAGQIIGTSAFIAVAACTAVTTAVVASTALVAAAATTTALVVTAVAAAAGVAGVVAPPTRPPASPSR